MDIIESIQDTLTQFRINNNIPKIEMSYMGIDELNNRSLLREFNKMDKFRKNKQNETDVDNEFPVEHYCRSWCKLSKQQKINRLMNYRILLVKKYNLNDDEEKQLSYLFIDNINNGKLQSKDEIDYIVEDAQIIRVHGLVKNGNTFHIKSNIDKKKTTIVETLIPLNLKSLPLPNNTISIASIIKQKIDIKKKNA